MAVPLACGPESAEDQDAAKLEAPDTIRVDDAVLVIGESASHDDDFMLPLAAGLDRDGNVYVFDAQARELRRFGSSGTRATLIAGRGDGPGELRDPTSFLVDSGLVGVWDGRRGRYTTLSETGRVIDEVDLGIAARPGVTTVLQSAASGEFIVAIISESSPHPDSIRGANNVAFLRVRPAARDHSVLHDWHGVVEWTHDTLYSYERPAASLSFHGGRARIADPGPRLGPIVMFDGIDPGFVRLDRPVPDRPGVAEFTLQRIALDGTLLNQTHFATSATAIPEHVRDSWTASVEDSPLPISGSAPVQASWPAYYPPVAGMLLSKHGDGRIWLELPPSPQGVGSTWVVLDRTFQPLTQVRLPRVLQYPIAAGPFIAGTVESEDGTRAILTFRIPVHPER